jgi:ATP-dependent helicase/nuclease subunit A
MKLSGAQLTAITRSAQDVCVVAGPGSGKTSVLVEHFAWLVEQGVSPLRILSITFTEKAANEIKQRLVKRFEHAADVRAGIERAYVSTIHGFCARLLRENAVAAGLDPDFAIQEDATGVVDAAAAAEEALDEMLRENPAVMRGLLEGFANRELAEDLVAVYEAIRSAGAGVAGATLVREPDVETALDSLQATARAVLDGSTDGWNPQQMEYLATQREWARVLLDRAVAPRWQDCLRAFGDFDCNLTKVKAKSEIRAALTDIKNDLLKPARRAVIGALFGAERHLLGEALVRFDTLYRSSKRAAAILDFADLEEHALRLLRERSEVRARIQQSFDAVLMDELQDTNPLQWQLIDMVRRTDRFFAVGDINQSIYGFRHADPDVFRAYRLAIEARKQPVDLLNENYRSRKDILDTVARVFAGAAGIERMPLIERGSFTAKAEPSVEVLVASGEDAAAASALEARWVAQRIRELKGTLFVGRQNAPRTARFSDIAVLVRTSACIEPLVAAFAEYQVPYLQSKGRTFFAAREVLDLTNWLRVLANPRDEVALAGVLRSPLVGVSDETLARVKMGGQLWESLAALAGTAAEFDAGDLERLLDARARIETARVLMSDVSPDLLAARALDESGYLDGIDSRARANIEKFLGLIRDLVAAAPATIAQLVDKLDVLREEQPEPEAPPAEAADAVNVMTVHAAKGLEFPIVFVAALHKGPSTQMPALTYHAASGLGARWRDPSNGETVPDPAHDAAAAIEKRRGELEADRLLFVAMTRAEEHLVLSFAKTTRMSGWAKQISSTLGVDLATFDNTPAVVEGVKVLRVDTPPPVSALNLASGLTAPLDLDRPLPGGQHDSTLTATSVALFAACPRKYFLGRYLGWKEERSAPIDFAEEVREAPVVASVLGEQVHALLAGAAVETPDPEALELASRFRASELGRRAERAEGVEREFDFLLAFDDVILRGQMDLWFEQGGELILVDYKTDRHENRAGSYALQLQLYALALKRIRGRLPHRAVLCYLRTGHDVDVPLDEVSLEAARTSVRTLSRAQDTLDFPLREGEQCARCGFYRGACPAGIA